MLENAVNYDENWIAAKFCEIELITGRFFIVTLLKSIFPFYIHIIRARGISRRTCTELEKLDYVSLNCQKLSKRMFYFLGILFHTSWPKSNIPKINVE